MTKEERSGREVITTAMLLPLSEYLRRGVLHRTQAHSCSDEVMRLPARCPGIVTMSPVTGTEHTTGLGRW